MRAGKWADAVGMLLRFAVACDGMGARNSECKAYLGAVVVWLHAGKANNAWATYQASRRGEGGGWAWRMPLAGWLAGRVASSATLSIRGCLAAQPACLPSPAQVAHSRFACPPPVEQDALGVDNFMSSDEAFAADALFDAYRRQGQRQQERSSSACCARVLLPHPAACLLGLLCLGAWAHQRPLPARLPRPAPLAAATPRRSRRR